MPKYKIELPKIPQFRAFEKVDEFLNIVKWNSWSCGSLRVDRGSYNTIVSNIKIPTIKENVTGRLNEDFTKSPICSSYFKKFSFSLAFQHDLIYKPLQVDDDNFKFIFTNLTTSHKEVTFLNQNFIPQPISFGVKQREVVPIYYIKGQFVLSLTKKEVDIIFKIKFIDIECNAISANIKWTLDNISAVDNINHMISEISLKISELPPIDIKHELMTIFLNSPGFDRKKYIIEE